MQRELSLPAHAELLLDGREPRGSGKAIHDLAGHDSPAVGHTSLDGRFCNLATEVVELLHDVRVVAVPEGFLCNKKTSRSMYGSHHSSHPSLGLSVFFLSFFYHTPLRCPFSFFIYHTPARR